MMHTSPSSRPCFEVRFPRNRPGDLPNPRPDYVRSTNTQPLRVGSDEILVAAAAE
jgi:hypothetical protein